jgi:thiamine-phosphate pyrophosphorylase
MRLVVISPERDRPDEHSVLEAFFAVGLERYHLRKPEASRDDLRAWIERVPSRWRSRLVLHQHHELVEVMSLGGRHWRDEAATPLAGTGVTAFTSRSCHTLATLRAALGGYSAVFFGPVFPSLSKPGYGPKEAQVGDALGAVLHTRSAAERRTEVIALGGVTAENLALAGALGFDGVAVLGAVWLAPDPVAALVAIRDAANETVTENAALPSGKAASGVAARSTNGAVACPITLAP